MFIYVYIATCIFTRVNDGINTCICMHESICALIFIIYYILFTIYPIFYTKVLYNIFFISILYPIYYYHYTTFTLIVMAEVYEEGLSPINKDGYKAIECYNRALTTVQSTGVISTLHKSTVYRYRYIHVLDVYIYTYIHICIQ